MRERLGIHFDIHQLSGSNPIVYERTYEIDPGFLYPIHERYLPYVKATEGAASSTSPKQARDPDLKSVSPILGSLIAKGGVAPSLYRR